MFYVNLLTVRICFMHLSECYISQFKCISVVIVVVVLIFNSMNGEASQSMKPSWVTPFSVPGALPASAACSVTDHSGL